MIPSRRLTLPFSDADREQAATFVAVLEDATAHPITEHIAEMFDTDEVWELATLLVAVTPAPASTENRSLATTGG